MEFELANYDVTVQAHLPLRHLEFFTKMLFLLEEITSFNHIRNEINS